MSPALGSLLRLPTGARPAPVAAPAPGRRLADQLVAGALVGAGLIHLVLIPRHFAESLLFGASFTAIAAFQGGLALGLLRRPGPGVYRAALLGSLGLVALWATTRLLAPPTGGGPEEVDVWGVLASGLELGAVVLLASSVPSLAARPRRRLAWAAAGGLGFAVLFLVASGSAGAGSPDPERPLFYAYTLSADHLSVTFPALVVLLGHGRVFVTLPWSTGVFLPVAAGLIAAQIYLGLGLAACAPRVAARRRGVLSLVPALFAAPVCCGAPLLSFLGTGAVLSALSFTPWLLIATSLLLAVGVWRLARERSRAVAGEQMACSGEALDAPEPRSGPARAK